MSWTSAYNSNFTKLMIRQLMAIIQRDQRAALDWVAGADVLLGIQNFQLAPTPTSQFPALLLAPTRSHFDQQAVGSLHYSTNVYCGIAVTHQDAQVLVEMVQDYVQALNAIFNTLVLPDFYVSLPLSLSFLGSNNPSSSPSPGNVNTVPLVVGTVKELFVLSHSYDEIKRNKQAFACTASLELVIDREES